MKKNEGLLDRTARTILGLSLISAALTGPQTPWGFIGIIPLVTGIVGYCPLYTLFGVRTCAIRKLSSTK